MFSIRTVRTLLAFAAAGLLAGAICGSSAMAQSQAMPASAAVSQSSPTPPSYGDPLAYRPAYPAATDLGMAAPVAGPTTLSPYADVPAASGSTGGNGNAMPITLGTGAIANDLATPRPLDAGAGAMVESQPLTANDYVEQVLTGEDHWTWQLLPSGLLYKTYLAGMREPRMGSRWSQSRGEGWVWDATLGARVGLFRYGTDDAIWPQGWQFDVEGAAFPRLDRVGDVVANDYIFAVPLTTRQGPWEWKYGYRHYCSHIGDEFLLKNFGFPRINYVRDSMFMGLAFYLNPNVRLYSEAGWGFWCDGGARPWEFQFGLDFSPLRPTTFWGVPFFAVNGHLRQENDYGGSVTVETGWQWRGPTGRLLRFGAHYSNGMSEQCQVYYKWEEQVGFGIWYDF